MGEETPSDRTQRAVEEIARVLLETSPPGTELRDVWDEALSIHRQRYAYTSRDVRLVL